MGIGDANHLGFEHGGIIMKLIDEAGGIVATRHSQRSVVTATLDSLIFLRPFACVTSSPCALRSLTLGAPLWKRASRFTPRMFLAALLN